MTIYKHEKYFRTSLSREDHQNDTFYRCNFDRADLRNSNFSGSKFYECSFQKVLSDNADLSNAEFYATCIDDVRISLGINIDSDIPSESGSYPKAGSGKVSSFRGGDLSGAKFFGILFNDSDFFGADLTNAQFIECDLSHCSFQQTIFHSPDVISNTEGEWVSKKSDPLKVFGKGSRLDFADFSNTNLRNLIFHECVGIEAADFSHADLNCARFSGIHDLPTNMYRARFDGARLTKCEFINCILDSVSFANTDMAGAILRGNTKAPASFFSQAYLPGLFAEKIDFTAAIFSGAYLSSGSGNDSATFRGANLIAADFSSSDVRRVNFNDADLTQSDFTHATFVEKSAKGEKNEGQDNNDNNEELKLINVTFQKADFTGASLSSCIFEDCDCSDAIFQDSILKHTYFTGGKTNLSRCNFSNADLFGAIFDGKDFQYQKLADNKMLPMNGTIFRGGILQDAEFRNAFLMRSSFEETNLKRVKFINCNMNYTNFSLSDLVESLFSNCCLETCRFEHSSLDKIRVENCSLSFASFIRAQGEGIIFKGTQHSERMASESEAEKSVSFRQCYLKGEWSKSISAAIIEYSEITLIDDSRLILQKGTKLTGSVINFNCGILKLSQSDVEYSSFEILNVPRSEFEFKISSVSNSLFKGLGPGCDLEDVSFDSCNLNGDWHKMKVRGCKFNMTVCEHKNIGISDIENSIIDNYDELSIASLRANAVSLGQDDDQDRFYGIEMEKKRGKKSEVFFVAGVATTLLFFLYPLIYYWGLTEPGTKGFESIPANGMSLGALVLIPLILLVMMFIFYYNSDSIFLKHLFNYGQNPLLILRNILLVIILFSVGWAISVWNSFSSFPSIIPISDVIKYFLYGLHYSISTFITIGYWQPVQGAYLPNGLMLVYSNIESLVGAVMIALLVVTLIRKTSPR